MTKKHQLAIQLKYEGKTHAEIVQALENKISVDTLNNWFAKNGKLYNDYIIYEKVQNADFLDVAGREVKRLFSQNALRAAQTIIDAYNAEVQEKHWGAAVRYATIILERIGLKSDAEPEEPNRNNNVNVNINSYDEFVDELKRLGVNIQTGTRRTVVEDFKDQQGQG